MNNLYHVRSSHPVSFEAVKAVRKASYGLPLVRNETLIPNTESYYTNDGILVALDESDPNVHIWWARASFYPVGRVGNTTFVVREDL